MCVSNKTSTLLYVWEQRYEYLQTKQTFVSENSVPDALSNFIHELCEIYLALLMVSYLGKAICRIVWKNGKWTVNSREKAMSLDGLQIKKCRSLYTFS